ncbi:MAG: MFS transporter [Acidimicrobiia bacterium]|nr:MFS transporter [Acidimicrobiia bacterium]MDX2466206.1 MFS transporter [Acidimicrobiia bacterium]
MREKMKPSWWGGRGHIFFTIVVFVTLASLDNAALAAIPSMVLPITEALNTSKAAIGFLTATVILITALSAVGWGYWGDRGDRKRLLFWGTLVWAAGSGLSSTATVYWQLFAWQILTAIGLGVIASVGFSVISDFVSPNRRGLAMSFWGLSQGIGGIIGGLLASQLGADDFSKALQVIALLGVAVSVLYLLTFDPPRGLREPALAELHASGAEYEYRIEPEQLQTLVKRPTNVWLILQGLSAQVAYGSLIWVPLLYQEKVMAAGYDLSTATKVGGILGAIFQIGGIFSILAGHIGDRVQRRTLRGRAIVSAIGILGAIPFFLLFFFIPLDSLEVTNGAGTATLIGEVLRNTVTNPWVAATFVTSVFAVALTGADSPNWFALISDVNLPEHRGTIFGVANFANGVGRSAGNGLTGAIAGAFETALPPPLNWAVGLSVFQIFFLPTGYCYYRASKTAPGDITEVRSILSQRAQEPTTTSSSDR